MRNVLIGLAIVGTVVPWMFFSRFIGENGLDLVGFVAQPFAANASAGFAADLIISAIVFLVWSSADARQRRVRNWWITIPAVALVGLSLALPLYLLMRERSAAPAHA
ncbi:MAG: DUF2834 domain-containing protein [Pseudomonadota bacterium]|nr:DUF2834 domain-containing protein [Pseudomonadota bacterium]